MKLIQKCNIVPNGASSWSRSMSPIFYSERSSDIIRFGQEIIWAKSWANSFPDVLKQSSSWTRDTIFSKLSV